MDGSRSRGPGRLLGVLALAVAGLLVGSAPSAAGAAGAVGSRPDPACRAATDRVPVLVEFPQSGRFSACVTSGGSGIDVLRRAGLEPITSAYGSVGGTQAVCALTHPSSRETIGCATGPSCLTCLAPDYWQYFPGYRFSPVGGGVTAPSPSRVEAWRWGRSQTWSGARPSAAELCPAPPPPTTDPPASTTAPGGGTIAAPPGTERPAGGGSGANDPPDGAAPSVPSGGPTATTTTVPSTAAPTTADGPRPAADDRATTTSRTAVAGPDDGDDDGDDEVAVGAPGGAVAITDDGGGGGSGAVIPVATTAGIVAVVGAFALQARRRRRDLDAPTD